MRGAFPGGRLAAAGPLTGHPPASHFLWTGRILAIHDHHDAPDVSLDMRRDVGVGAIESEAMYTAVGLKKSDFFRLLASGDIVNFESGRLFLFAAVPFQVHQHDVAAHLDFVRMHALGNFDLRDGLWMLGVSDVEDSRAVRRVHVTDKCVAVLHYYLAAARQIRPTDPFYIFADAKFRRGCLAHEFFSRSSRVGSCTKPEARRSTGLFANGSDRRKGTELEAMVAGKRARSRFDEHGS